MFFSYLKIFFIFIFIYLFQNDYINSSPIFYNGCETSYLNFSSIEFNGTSSTDRQQIPWKSKFPVVYVNIDGDSGPLVHGYTEDHLKFVENQTFFTRIGYKPISTLYHYTNNQFHSNISLQFSHPILSNVLVVVFGNYINKIFNMYSFNHFNEPMTSTDWSILDKGKFEISNNSTNPSFDQFTILQPNTPVTSIRFSLEDHCINSSKINCTGVSLNYAFLAVSNECPGDLFTRSPFQTLPPRHIPTPLPQISNELDDSSNAPLPNHTYPPLSFTFRPIDPDMDEHTDSSEEFNTLPSTILDMVWDPPSSTTGSSTTTPASSEEDSVGDVPPFEWSESEEEIPTSTPKGILNETCQSPPHLPGINIGGTIYFDVDHSGTISINDTKVQKISIILSTERGVFIKNVTSNKDGNYLFKNIQPGKYILNVEKSTMPSHTKIVVNSKESPYDLNGQLSILAHKNNYTLNALIDKETIAINGRMIEAASSEKEPNAPWRNITLELYSSTEPGILLSTQTTNEYGYYLFDNLYPREYIIKIDKNELPPNYTFLDTSPLSKFNLNDEYGSFRVDASDLNPDFIERPLGSPVKSFYIVQNQNGYIASDLFDIFGYLYNDTNGDGQSDTNEMIPGVDVSLIDLETNSTIMNSTTNEVGLYKFSNLAKSRYSIKVPDQIILRNLNWIPFYKNDFGPRGELLVNFNEFQKNPNRNQTFNATFIKQYDGGLRTDDFAIFGRIRMEYDCPAFDFSNITITLNDRRGKQYNSTKTDRNGNFRFPHVQPNAYLLKINISTLPPNTELLSSTNINEFNQNGDTFLYVNNYNRLFETNVWPSKVEPAIYKSNQSNGILSVTFNHSYTVTGRLMKDVDRSRNLTSDDVPWANVGVYLLGTGLKTHIFMETRSNNEGIYTFKNVAQGIYIIRTDPSQLPVGMTYLDDSSDSCFSLQGYQQGTINVTVFNNPMCHDSVNSTLDQYIVNVKDAMITDETFEINGQIFNDANRNAMIDYPELLYGVNVTLYRLSDMSIVRTALTSLETRNGFVFSHIYSGQYVIKAGPQGLPLEAQWLPTDSNWFNQTGYGYIEVSRTNWIFVKNWHRKVDSTDNYIVTFNGGVSSPDYLIQGELCFYPVSKLSNVSIHLLDSDNHMVAQTNTNASGWYTFNHIKPSGSYTLKFDLSSLPPNVSMVYPDYAHSVFERDGTYRLALYPNNPLFEKSPWPIPKKRDISMYNLWQIMAFTDTNDAIANDRFDLTGHLKILQTPLNVIAPWHSVTVKLLNYSNIYDVLHTTTSDTDGVYSFKNLTTGPYYISIDPSELPSGYVFEITKNSQNLNAILKPGTFRYVASKLHDNTIHLSNGSYVNSVPDTLIIPYN